jgi:hypothetical protein
MIRALCRTSPEAKEFIKFLRDDLRSHRVHLSFSKTRMVRFSKNLLTAGFFLEPTGRKWGMIRVGCGNRKPINILMNLTHEYVHFLQWKNRDSLWTHGNGDHINGSQYVELEERTEQDAISLLREWNIPANYGAIRSRSRSYISYLRDTEINK